jgi:hypothetical protein
VANCDEIFPLWKFFTNVKKFEIIEQK